MSKKSTGLKESDFANNLWNYFAIHAKQRIQILNFFIVLETFFITALFSAYKFGDELLVLRVLLGIAIIFFSVVFKLLDNRSKEMIKYSEDALKSLEQKYKKMYGEDMMIFSIEKEKCKKTRALHVHGGKTFSYSQLFWIIFFFFILIGVCSIGLEIHNMLYR